jgi:hypothetical protein
MKISFVREKDIKLSSFNKNKDEYVLYTTITLFRSRNYSIAHASTIIV